MSFLPPNLGPADPLGYQPESPYPALLPVLPTRRFTVSVTPNLPLWYRIDVRAPAVLRFRTRADAQLSDAVESIILAIAPGGDSPTTFAQGYPAPCGRAFLANPGAWWYSINMQAPGVRNLDLELVDATNPASLPSLLGFRNASDVHTEGPITLTGAADTMLMSANQYVERIAASVTNMAAGAPVQVAWGISAANTGQAAWNLAPSGQAGDSVKFDAMELPLLALHAAFPSSPFGNDISWSVYT